MFGCLALPGIGRALPIGRIEPAARPMDADAAMAALGPLVARGTRVVTIGTDVDVLVSLRQALSRQGVSVSMAWDAKQAADLLLLVHPEVLVLDLGLPQHEGHRILARLSAAEPVPATLLVPGADDAIVFGTICAQPAHAQRLLPLDRLLAGLFGRKGDAPPGR
jgi:CheY-like chemotaxis protein